MSTVTTLSRRRFRTPEEVSEALGIPFSDEQLTAISAELEPGVIIAGAGTGKTAVMAARVVWLVGKGQVRPDQVLGLTFTRKAASELAHRVRTALITAGVLQEGSDDQGEEVIMTYDAFAGRLLTEHGQRIGAEIDPVMVTGATRFRLAERVVRDAAGPFDHLSNLRPETLVERVLKLDSMLASHLVTTDQVRAHTAIVLNDLMQARPNRLGNTFASVRKAIAAAQERLELLDLVDDYSTLKQREGVVEFADQMRLAADLVARVPSVGDAMRVQFHAVLLDEYQDTSSAQAQLLRGLFAGERGAGHPVTAVGDPFQAIYGWRGAAASNILHFHREFPRSLRPEHDGHRFKLTINRRSGQKILDVANDLAEPLRADELLLRHDPEAEGTPGELRAPDDRQGGEVRAAMFTGWPEEVAWVADRIVDLQQSGRLAAWSDCAVLLRRNADMGTIFEALTARDVPTEIVGLGGLLEVAEVADVVDTLTLVDDVTANPSAVRLLSGPRWAVGARDLALLGRRARELAGRPGASAADIERDLFTDLADSVAETDHSEVVSLLDAIADPGPLPYSEEARERFAAFTAELSWLRRHGDEPVLDQVRRVITVLGLDIELEASGRVGAGEQLATFVDAVAQFVDVDMVASLSSMLAWLDAERRYGVGLEQATPSERNSVKLLTVHRAKGLEWNVVFLPGLNDKTFPTDRGADNWLTTAAVLPARLRGDADSIPQASTLDDEGIGAYADALKKDIAQSEGRLAYVAATRARELLVVSAHQWRPGTKKPRLASTYFTTAREEAERQGAVDHDVPAAGSVNPLEGPLTVAEWPCPPEPDVLRRRREAAAIVERARAHHERVGDWPAVSGLTRDELDLVALWDDQIALLEAEATGQLDAATLPETLSATALVNAHHDPQAFARQMVRPMPRPVSEAAQLGTRFHAWVERHYGLSSLAEPLVEVEDEDITSDEQLEKLKQAFLATRWADRTPIAVEVPFTLVLAGRVLRGQIDAAFPADDGVHDHVLVDWKTSMRAADPMQLAIYREAWAQARGLDPNRIDAVFVHVATGAEHKPERLASREELEHALTEGMRAVVEMQQRGRSR